MELPEELTAAETELKSIYAEYHTLKNEDQKKREAAEAAASKKRASDVVAEDSTAVLKKLKSSGLLEKLHSESAAPKTQFKRAGNLERRLQTQKTPSVTQAPSVTANTPSEDFPKVSKFGAVSESSAKPSSPAFSRKPRNDPPTPQKPKSLYDAFLSDDSDTSDSKVPYNSGEKHSDSDRETARDVNSWRPSPRGHSGPGFRQKMVRVEADRVDESFLRPVFEKFGPLIRMTCNPQYRQAYVLFQFYEDSQRAVEEMNAKVIDGVTIHVSVAERRPDQVATGIPRRMFPDAGPPPGSKPDTRELITYEEGEIT